MRWGTDRRSAAALAPTGSDTMVKPGSPGQQPHGALQGNPVVLPHCPAGQQRRHVVAQQGPPGTRGPRRHPELAVENRRPRGTPRHRCPDPGQEYPTISLPTTFKARRADFPRPPFVRPGNIPASWSTTLQIRSDKHFCPDRSRKPLRFRHLSPLFARNRSG